MDDELRKWVDDVLRNLADALQEFGSYTFWDKGPDEVMYIDGYASRLKSMPGEKAGKFLEALGTVDGNKEAEHLASVILGQCDDANDEWWEACCSAAPSVEY